MLFNLKLKVQSTNKEKVEKDLNEFLKQLDIKINAIKFDSIKNSGTMGNCKGNSRDGVTLTIDEEKHYDDNELAHTILHEIGHAYFLYHTYVLDYDINQKIGKTQKEREANMFALMVIRMLGEYNALICAERHASRDLTTNVYKTTLRDSKEYKEILGRKQAKNENIRTYKVFANAMHFVKIYSEYNWGSK